MSTSSSTPLMPVVEAWPECSGCGTAYVLRWSFRFTGDMEWEWLWQRDCKHRGKSPDPVIRTAV